MDLLARLDTADLVDDILGRLGGHDLGKLLGLLVFFDILETEGHLNGIEKELDVLTVLGKLGSGGDETLLAGQLAERSTTNTLNNILKMRVTDTRDDLVDVGGLGLFRDAVLGNDEVLGLV